MTHARFNPFRLSLIATSLLASATMAPSHARADDAAAEAAAKESLTWHAVKPANIEGQGWTDVKSPFDRLPARAEGMVRPPVWNLSHNSAGLYVDFSTNAPRIAVRWTLNSQTLSMPHMPATGVSGVDLYVRNDDGWHFLANGQAREFPNNEAEFTASEASAAEDVQYRLYLPLYNGVKSVEIGVPEGSSFGFVVTEDASPPIVVYGTSITQGGCAARPGMAYASILNRRLDREFINLGFSGNGQTEPELATLLAELGPAAFVIDSLPNLTPEMLAERMPKFLEIIRERHPQTPILLVQNPLYPTISFVASTREKVTKANEILTQIHADRVAAGDRAITLVPACDLAADGGETTVDGVHPTDVGFLRLADALEPYLRKALASPTAKNK
jgi:lysophospholipase L1-like esterase